jgi:hypothetical protein
VVVRTPGHLSPRERELYEELAELSRQHNDSHDGGFFGRVKDKLGI